jgi:hypothetical protein
MVPSRDSAPLSHESRDSTEGLDLIVASEPFLRIRFAGGESRGQLLSFGAMATFSPQGRRKYAEEREHKGDCVQICIYIYIHMLVLTYSAYNLDQSSLDVGGLSSALLLTLQRLEVQDQYT